MKFIHKLVAIFIVTIGLIIWELSDAISNVGLTKVLEVSGVALLGCFLLSLPFWFKPLVNWMNKKPNNTGVKQ